MPDKKMVGAITSMDEDFAQWYTDVIKKAELADYSSVKGCVILRPYGYAIWELIQSELDKRFKACSHENVYMPLFIPESLLNKEKDHIKGFAPEVAWVTLGGDEPLSERLCVRPTSETLFCEHYANTIQSHRDLPKLYNQWCSVVRWEKTTRPFLRTREFLWQEGHTAHATAVEAEEETIRMLNIYEDFCADTLAIPVIKGRKTDNDKFAGAKETYAIESLMHDGKALQAGTSHNFGDGFARAFGIQYSNENNDLKYVHQTSWGVSTRLIGGIIMVHGDDSGLLLPPNIAPVQAVIVPVAMHKAGVVEKCAALREELAETFRIKLDLSDKSPGWKFSEYEMKGVPVRIELGPKDIEEDRVIFVRRDTREKIPVPSDNIKNALRDLMNEIQNDLYKRAQNFLISRTHTALNLVEFEEILQNSPGFIRAMWCGDVECEEYIKEKYQAGSRVIPFVQERLSEQCFRCGKKAVAEIYWARAY